MSLIRLKALIFWAVQDAPYKNSMAMICTSLESTLGITCACIVVMRPLFGKIFPDRLRFKKTTNRFSTDHSTSSNRRLSRKVGWIHPRLPSRVLSEDGAGSQGLRPGNFQRLDNLYPFTHGAGVTNTTTVEVGTAAGAYGGNRKSQVLSAKRSLSPGSIMVRREWEIDSCAV